jgi:hypothetical protein
LKPRPIRVKSPSGQEYEVDWTADDVWKSLFCFSEYYTYVHAQEKELDGLTVYEQRKRKEQMLAEKKRKVAEMKRQQEVAIQQRLKKQRESLVGILDQAGRLFSDEEQDR